MTVATTQTFEPDGRAIPFADEGDGPVRVVLLPARGFGIESLGTIAHVLEEEGFRVIRIGVRAAGSVPDAPLTLHVLAEDVISVLDSVGVDSAFIGGHAFGGALARTVALDHPERAEGLVLLGVTDAQPPAEDVARALETAFADAPAEERRAAVGLLAGDADPDLALAHLSRTRNLDAAVVQDAALAATPAEEWAPVASSLAVLVIQAEADTVTPTSAAEALQASAPERVSLARVPGAGYLAPLTHPGETAWEIEDYLAWD
jgi:pimeloyl-ACP methyl ester carboxylesterase